MHHQNGKVVFTNINILAENEQREKIVSNANNRGKNVTNNLMGEKVHKINSTEQNGRDRMTDTLKE
jgi:hypothetical protein